MANPEEELSRLAEDRVAHDQLIWVGYSFFHPFSDWGQRRAFREALHQAGFTGIGSDEEISGDGYWHHWSWTIRSAEPEVLKLADLTASTLAGAHGVRYEGWEVGRNFMTHELRPASAEDIERLRVEDEKNFRIAQKARIRRERSSD